MRLAKTYTLRCHYEEEIDVTEYGLHPGSPDFESHLRQLAHERAMDHVETEPAEWQEDDI